MRERVRVKANSCSNAVQMQTFHRKLINSNVTHHTRYKNALFLDFPVR